jgi:pheromone shutdown protein TraB
LARLGLSSSLIVTSVTSTQILDQLNFFDLVKCISYTIYWLMSLPLIKHKDFNNEEIMMKQVRDIAKVAPILAEVILHERDEYRIPLAIDPRGSSLSIAVVWLR